MGPQPGAENREAERALDEIERDHRLRPTSPRERLVIVLLAVATASGVLLMVLDPWARLERMNRPPPDRPACEGGQTRDCVGGKIDVIVLPASAPGR